MEAWLLERFNVVVSKKGEQKKDDKGFFNLNKNTESIDKLEQRISGLEHQNDQLLNFINFLLDNLPDLVINIIHSNNETSIELDPSGDHCEEPCCADPCPTRREKEVLELLVKGYCAKEIANRLYISETTVITHKKNLKEKFNALVETQKKHVLSMFSTSYFLNQRYFRSAMRKLGLERFFLRRMQLKSILNYSRCEAHKDITFEVLLNYLKTK